MGKQKFGVCWLHVSSFSKIITLFSGNTETPDMEKLLKAFAARFTGGLTNISLKKFPNKEAMIDELKKDISNISITSPAYIGR